MMREGYDQTDFEMIECGAQGKYEVPTSTAAHFRLSQELTADEFQQGLESKGYAFIAPYIEGKKLDSKVYDGETNEFFHVKLYKNSLRVYPKDEDFSFETFQRAVNHAAEMSSGLKLVGDEDGV